MEDQQEEDKKVIASTDGIHLVPQLCVCEDEAKEEEVGEKGDDADDQDGQPYP